MMRHFFIIIILIFIINIYYLAVSISKKIKWAEITQDMTLKWIKQLKIVNQIVLLFWPWCPWNFDEAKAKIACPFVYLSSRPEALKVNDDYWYQTAVE